METMNLPKASVDWNALDDQINAKFPRGSNKYCITEGIEPETVDWDLVKQVTVTNGRVAESG